MRIRKFEIKVDDSGYALVPMPRFSNPIKVAMQSYDSQDPSKGSGLFLWAVVSESIEERIPLKLRKLRVCITGEKIDDDNLTALQFQVKSRYLGSVVDMLTELDGELHFVELHIWDLGEVGDYIEEEPSEEEKQETVPRISKEDEEPKSGFSGKSKKSRRGRS